MLLSEKKLTSRRLFYRNLRAEDACSPYVDWFGNPETIKFLASSQKGVDEEYLRQFINQNNNSPSEMLLGILSKSKIHIGNVRLLDINQDFSRASVGILIGDKKHWGRGFASECLETVTGWAHQTLGIRRLFAGCHEKNIGTIKAFEKAGYVRVNNLPPELADQDNWRSGIEICHIMMVNID